jgi:hypothetical protein
MSINFAQASPVPAWLIFNGITISGNNNISGPAHDLTFTNVTFTGQIVFYPGANNNACSSCSAMNNNNLVFDGDVFNLAEEQSGTGGYEGRIQFVYGGPTPAGITIKNSKFTTGCADGIQLGGAGAGNGVTIGPNNEFYNLMQGSCGPHVDSIQFNGDENGPNSSTGPIITGNYFHDNSTGIVSYDYDSNATITNNVVTRIGNNVGIGLAGFDSNSIVEHNTVFNNEVDCDVTHEGNVCHAVIRNNIITDGIHLTTSGGTGSPSFSDYNFCSSGGCPGSHSINSGTPTYVGGSSPNSYSGFALTSTSIGNLAASDGKNIGINATTTTTGGPSPPTSLVAAVQ